MENWVLFMLPNNNLHIRLLILCDLSQMNAISENIFSKSMNNILRYSRWMRIHWTLKYILKYIEINYKHCNLSEIKSIYKKFITVISLKLTTKEIDDRWHFRDRKEVVASHGHFKVRIRSQWCRKAYPILKFGPEKKVVTDVSSNP